MKEKFKLVSYEEAKEAVARGEVVERKHACANWEIVHNIEAHDAECGCRFRIVEPVDPYAEMKAAHAVGKVIQAWAYEIDDNQSKVYRDVLNPTWTLPVSFYRIKPNDLKIESGWQPIETAPKGTRSIMVHCAERRNTYIVTWVSGWRIFGGGYSAELPEPPTHWRPLPESPTDTPAPYTNWDKLPAWAEWQAKDADGAWWWFELEPTQGEDCFCTSRKAAGATPPTHSPTNFTGTWDQSLQQRPKP